MNHKPSGETRRLAEFISATTYDDLPDPITDHVKRMALDTIGVAIAASDTPVVNIVRDRYMGVGGGDRSTGRAHVLGTDLDAPVGDAAFVNGVMAHALDFDDGHPGLRGHPSATVLPTCLALGESIDASGRDLLRAYALGAEVELELGGIMNPGHKDAGWHSTATIGHFGATVAAGVLLDLDVEELQTALGIAGSNASGISANFGTMTKPYHAGIAARSGIECAELADAGFTASRDVLENEIGGFFDLFRGTETGDVSPDMSGLGDEWTILAPPVGFKKYPCCASTHQPIEAVKQIRDQHGIEWDDVRQLELTEHPNRLGHTNRPEPDDSLDAKFSVQYLIALAFREGEVWIDDFDDEKIAVANESWDLDKIDVSGDGERFQDQIWGLEMTVRTEEGDVIDHVIMDRIRMDYDDVERKYRKCVEEELSSERADETIDAIQNLDEFDSVADDLLPLLTA